MKKAKNIFRNKLINTTILLIVAALVFSNAQGAFVSDTNIENEPQISREFSAVQTNAAYAGITPPTMDTRVDFLGFDDGYTENSWAYNDGSPWQAAIQLTDTELTGYRNYDITQVMFSCGCDDYGFEIADYEIWISDQLEDPTAPPVVYGSGTSSGIGWDTVDLDMPYAIPDTGDVYIGITYSNYGVGVAWPAGVDETNYVPEGFWFYYSGVWQDANALLGPAVWGLDAGVEPGGSGPEHDVGVTTIVSPESGPAGVITPAVKVKNFGNNTETAVPVEMDIGITDITTVTAFEEHFEGTFPPTGWTSIINAGSYGWERNDFWGRPNYAGTGYCADADVDAAYSYPMDCELISPIIDLSTFTSATLEWNNYFYLFADVCTVDISIDGGATWSNLYTAAQYQYGVFSHTTIDISAYCGSSTTMIRFHYYAPSWDYYWEVDDVMISTSTMAYTSEYNEVVYVDVPVGQTIDVVFPAWTPAAWQNEENVDILYDMSACTLLADDNPANDCKLGSFSLNFPYLHDVAVIDIAPTGDGPAQTLGVTATVKNIGQFPECCFFTNMQIGQQVYGDVIFSEDFSVNSWSTLYPSNWYKSYTANAGGTSPEYVLYWYPYSDATYRLWSPAFDTSGYSTAQLSFKHYLNHFTTPYTIQVETSTDGGATWTPVWQINPTSSMGPETIVVPITVGSPNLQIAFTLVGYVYNINYWYVDDVQIVETSMITEYNENRCVPDGVLINPGEELELTYPDWTPADLALGISGDIDYIIAAETLLATDTNPANDVLGDQFNLDFWHDVKVAEITSPTDGRGRDVFYAFNSYPGDESVWFESSTPGVLNTIAPNTAPNFIPAGTWADGVWYVSDYGTGNLYTVDPSSGAMTLIGGSVAGGWNGIAYDGSTMYGATSTALYSIDIATGTPTFIGNMGNAGLMIDIAIDQDTGICYGHDIVDDAIYTIDLGTGAATYLGATGIFCNYAQSMEFDQNNDILYLAAYTTQGELYTCDTTTGHATLVGAFQGGAEVTALAIPYSGGGPGPGNADVFAQPGTQNIGAMVQNDGTFPELDLITYAEIWEFISDPNGTLVYTDQINGIDLDPLGGEQALSFMTYNFAIEGLYTLTIDIPLAVDDKQNNNMKTITIGIDDTAPMSTHSLAPSAPTGLNGWYVDNVVVTLDGNDGTEAFQSGVDVIKYQVDGGAVQSVSVGGTFTISTDGIHTIQYWAVDNVGNEEAKNSFEIKMDQTAPIVDLTWESAGGLSKDIIFTATCSDAMSGMDKVDFQLNDVSQYIDNADPYEWIMTWAGGTKFTIKSIAYDLAGNSAFDTLASGEGTAQSQSITVTSTPAKLIK